MNKLLFGITKKNQKVFQYIFSNEFISISILNYGGIIQELRTYDYKRNFENIILGYDNLESYEVHQGYFGSIIGRNAGRISHGEFSIDNKLYSLNKNDNSNHLHGGIKGLDKKVWEEISFSNNKLILFYKSPNKEENYPGNVEFLLTYELQKNTLIWTITGVTDQKTPINITNHTYFNLSACKDLAINHILQINADYYFPITQDSIPEGNLVSVNNTAFDFIIPKKISKDIDNNEIQLHLGNGYDHPFALNKKCKEAIKLYDDTTKRQLRIFTNQDICVFYTGNYLSKSEGYINSNILCQKHLGICFETQNIPNAINISQYEQSAIITPQKNYFQENIWEFSINKEYNN